MSEIRFPPPHHPTRKKTLAHGRPLVEPILHRVEWCPEPVDGRQVGMEARVELLKQQSLAISKANPDPKITIQNQESLAQARDLSVVLQASFRKFPPQVIFI
jgi:hypothetical protein